MHSDEMSEAIKTVFTATLTDKKLLLKVHNNVTYIG